jgi:hypothetical protein
MQPFRLLLATLAVLAVLVAGACQTTGDWTHSPSSPQGEDLKMYSVQEAIPLYKDFYAARGFYLFIAVPEGQTRPRS